MIRRYESTLPGAAAERLFRRGWLPAHPHAALLLVHGFAEHSGRYEHVGRWLARRGVAVHAYDHLGHGHSSGARCHVSRFDAYLDDLERVLGRVREDTPRLPLFALGHSMGGLVVASAALERPLGLTGLALSGPALGLPASTPRLRLALARGVRVLLPRLRLDAGLDLEGLCSDPIVVEAYRSDPLVERRMSVSLACELRARMGRTGARGAELPLPLLALHGEDDCIAPPEATRDFAAAAPQGRYLGYPGMRHEILNEPDHETVLADLLAWLEERLTVRQSAAGSLA